jgi:hypothetical protein
MLGLVAAYLYGRRRGRRRCKRPSAEAPTARRGGAGAALGTLVLVVLFVIGMILKHLPPPKLSLANAREEVSNQTLARKVTCERASEHEANCYATGGPYGCYLFTVRNAKDVRAFVVKPQTCRSSSRPSAAPAVRPVWAGAD